MNIIESEFNFFPDIMHSVILMSKIIVNSAG